ncbi:MAG: hypothetical protein ABIX12_08835 [Rubrivivax sp.]
MPALSLNHVNLSAEQPMLDALRDFYVDVIGLHVGWRPPFELLACGVNYRRDAIPGPGLAQLFMQDQASNGVELTFVERDN